MKTIIVNLKKDKYDVYIGRGSRWGNPYKIGIDGTREEVIQKFKKYFENTVAMADPMWKFELMELKGKRLGCFCKPLACHGDIIAEYLEAKI